MKKTEAPTELYFSQFVDFKYQVSNYGGFQGVSGITCCRYCKRDGDCSVFSSLQHSYGSGEPKVEYLLRLWIYLLYRVPKKKWDYQIPHILC